MTKCCFLVKTLSVVVFFVPRAVQITSGSAFPVGEKIRKEWVGGLSSASNSSTMRKDFLLTPTVLRDSILSRKEPKEQAVSGFLNLLVDGQAKQHQCWGFLPPLPSLDIVRSVRYTSSRRILSSRSW